MVEGILYRYSWQAWKRKVVKSYVKSQGMGDDYRVLYKQDTKMFGQMTFWEEI